MEAWIRLTNILLPPRQARDLLDIFGSPEALFAASGEDLMERGQLRAPAVSKILDPSNGPTNTQLASMERLGARIVPCTDPDYPKALLDVPDAPVALYVRGRLDERDRFAVGIVGTRQASPYGRSVTSRLVRDLCAAGLTIVSGGALGIDGVAHKAAVDSGGRTIAVLGCGLDIDYPQDNRSIFDAIVERDQGALISEFPLGSKPEPFHFPMRNRIISGLSMAVVVTEAGERSGALITAQTASEQGRDVMAVPGPIDRPYSRGTNGLIRDGAVLVESAADVTRALGMLTLEPPPSAAPVSANKLKLPEAQQKLIEQLSLSPKHIDALAADVRLSSQDVGVQLTFMELAGLVRRLPGNCYIRVL